MVSLRSDAYIIFGTALISVSREQTIATAFAPVGFHPHSHHASLLTPLKVTIYYPDGEDTDNSSGYDNSCWGPLQQGGGTSTPVQSEWHFGPLSQEKFIEAYNQLATLLGSETSTLAKLASAFSPPGYDIILANVNDVRCASLDNCHLEIEAVVCDDSECSSLLVNIDFPGGCCILDEGLEECILRNIQRLNAEGETVLQKREQIFAEEEESRRAMDVLGSLDSEYLKSSSASAALPSWWEPPISAEDVEECNLIRQLLNGGDFCDMLRGLAGNAMQHNSSDELEGTIRAVRVTHVGPAGMILKVHFGGLNNESVMDVSINFAEMSPQGGNSLEGGRMRRSIREKVLSLVS